MLYATNAARIWSKTQARLNTAYQILVLINMGNYKDYILLELFAGSRSIGKVAEELKIPVFSTDLEAFDKIDLVKNVLDLNVKDLPLKNKTVILWASVPCTTFSVASIGYHWHENHTPKTEAAVKGLELVQKTLELIKEIKPKYWFIENPRGKLRKLPIMQGLPRATVWYCRYNDKRAKPTDIWSNNIANLFNYDGWQPRPLCYNNNKKCHHEEAPRGSKTGTQGIKGNYNRSVVPYQLCKEILLSCV